MTSVKRCGLGLILLMIVCAAHAADNLTLLYQTRVLIGTTPYVGPAQIKFALVDDASGKSIWSNDGSSVAGSEPSAAVDVTSVAGVVSVMVGDDGLANMDALPNIIVNRRAGLSLRVWFNDLTNGWEQLAPDLSLPAGAHTMQRVTQPLTLFVDAAIGDDANAGLTTDTAKQTIQAAVDMLPPQLDANVVIEVADGVYREQVDIVNITTKVGATLELRGDVYSGNGEVTVPAVRVTGTDDDGAGSIDRPYGFTLRNVNTINLTGFAIDFAASSIYTENSRGTFDRIRTTGKGPSGGVFGVSMGNGSWFYMSKVWCINGQSGISVYGNSSLQLNGDCGAIGNLRGMVVNSSSYVLFHAGSGIEKFSNNTTGIYIYGNSVISFDSSLYSGRIQNNGIGIELYDGSVSRNAAVTNTMSGNGTNIYTSSGGASY